MGERGEAPRKTPDAVFGRSVQGGKGAAGARRIDAADAVACPACGESNVKTYRFCRVCGAKAGAAPAPADADDAQMLREEEEALAREMAAERRSGNAKAPRPVSGPNTRSPKPARDVPPVPAAKAASPPPLQVQRSGSSWNAARKGSAVGDVRIAGSRKASGPADGPTDDGDDDDDLVVPVIHEGFVNTAPRRVVTGRGRGAGPPPKGLDGSQSEIVGSWTARAVDEAPLKPPSPRASTLVAPRAAATADDVVKASSPRSQTLGAPAGGRSVKRGLVTSGDFAGVLDSRTADTETRDFLQRVVKYHNEGIQQEEDDADMVALGLAARASKGGRLGTLGKKRGVAAAAKKRPTADVSDSGKRDLAEWLGLGLDMIVEEDGGGMPFVVAAVLQYFAEKKCHASAGLLKQSGTAAAVNRILTAIVDGTFVSFDQLEVTYLDVASALRSFLLALPDSVVPGAIFRELTDAVYETDPARRVEAVRTQLARMSGPRRAVLRAVLVLLRRVVAMQQHLKLGDAAKWFGPALARPPPSTELDVADTDPQSYALVLALLEVGEDVFEAAGPVPTSAGMSSPALLSGSRILKSAKSSSVLLQPDSVASVVDEPAALAVDPHAAEELAKATDKVDSLTRQLEHSRKAEASLKHELEKLKKENSELKRKNQQLTKQVEGYRANQILDLY